LGKQILKIGDMSIKGVVGKIWTIQIWILTYCKTYRLAL
jgi:hypothetical protein